MGFVLEVEGVVDLAGVVVGDGAGAVATAEAVEVGGGGLVEVFGGDPRGRAGGGGES